MFEYETKLSELSNKYKFESQQTKELKESLSMVEGEKNSKEKEKKNVE